MTARVLAPASRRIDWRVVSALLSIAILVGGVLFVVYAWDYWQSVAIPGADYRIYMHAAERWVDTGQPYLPYQLEGPYLVNDHRDLASPILYPPTTMLLFAAFLWLPAFLWWAIPIGITAWVVWSHHPRPLVWPVLAFLFAFPMTLWFIATGNPLLWFVAAVAGATLRGPSGALVLLKPTLLPFALVGVWRRSWWIGLAALAFVSLAFLPLWDDYRLVLTNAVGGIGPLYSINQYPAMMIPIVAWLGSSRFAKGSPAEQERASAPLALEADQRP